MTPRLMIAAHGSRDAAGEQDARRFVDRVRAAMPDVDVRVGFVELSEPPLAEAMTEVAREAGDEPIVVLPLMLGSGGHAKRDIPGAIAAGVDVAPDADWRYAAVLGPDPRLVEGLVSRIDAVRDHPDGVDRHDDTTARRTTVLLVGRGSSDVDSQANVADTARRVMHLGGYDSVETCFIAVSRPGVEDGLERVARLVTPDTPVVVAPYLLFRGLMIDDVRARVEAWRAANPGRLDRVAVADVLGEDDALVDLVRARYAAACEDDEPAPGGAAPVPTDDADGAGATGVPAPFVAPYLAGLRLAGRPVTVVGGGAVARRRVAGLLCSGADVTVVAPDVVEEVRDQADRGRIRWQRRGFTAADLDGAWYAVACTDDPAVNAGVGEAAQERGIFCVRADDGGAATAWTPAVGHHGELTVAVLANRQPHRSRAVRDQILSALDDGSISPPALGSRPGASSAVPDEPTPRHRIPCPPTEESS